MSRLRLSPQGAASCARAEGAVAIKATTNIPLKAMCLFSVMVWVFDSLVKARAVEGKAKILKVEN